MVDLDVEIDGRAIFTERDVHVALARVLDFGPYYGYNLDALWDVLSRDVERPVMVVWRYSDISKLRLGAVFDQIVALFDCARREDLELGSREIFDYELR